MATNGDDWNTVEKIKVKKSSLQVATSAAASADGTKAAHTAPVPPKRNSSGQVTKQNSNSSGGAPPQPTKPNATRGGQGRSKSFSVGVQRTNSSASQNTNRRGSYGQQNSSKGIGRNNSNSLSHPQTQTGTNTSGTANAKKGGGGGKLPARSHSYSVAGSSPKHAANNKTTSNNNNNSSPYKQKLLQEITLLNSTGTGDTEQHQLVIRFSADFLLSKRMQYTDAPNKDDWTPHDRCWWQAPDRLLKLEQEQSLYYNFKPLTVNDETRWKPKGLSAADMSQQDAILASITAILNKLSWTNLDKLTLKFVETLGVGNTNNSDTVISQDLVQRTMQVVVGKAMLEPHFAELYARLSVKLAGIHKAFKRTVLQLCQEQFEVTDSEERNNEDKSAAEREAANVLARKKSIGLMKFIGELYVMKLIKAEIMLSCCDRLLNPQDEEKLESFCKLMTTIGKRLHSTEEQQGCEVARAKLWDQVYSMAGKKQGGPVAPSTRIKFLLQALIELKENNWVQVRHEHEKAKTIAQIHKEVAAEAKRGPVTKTASAVLKRSQSGGALQPAPPRRNSSSKPSTTANTADGSVCVAAALPGKPKPHSLRRVKSEVSSANGVSSLQRAMAGAPVSEKPAKQQQLASFTEHHLDPKECGDKIKTILKEYFVSGDRGEAVLLVDEMVVMGSEGHVERGAAVVQAGVLLVMEMKEAEVRKFLEVISKCLDDQKLDKASLVPGLNDPLEFLRDIEIDAPLAANLLAIVVADWIKKKVDDGDNAIHSIEFLLNAPEYFRTDGQPAAFAAQILKHRGGDVTEVDIHVVTALLSEDEKKAHSTTNDFLKVHMS